MLICNACLFTALIMNRCKFITNESKFFRLQKREIKLKAWIILIVLSLLSCSSLASDSFEINRLDSETLEYRGAIKKGSHAELVKYLDEKIRVLKITSNGGNPLEAMNMAKELWNRDIHLRVEEICFSACANYLFLGAKTKSIEANSLLGFHGYASSILNEEIIETFRSTMDDGKLNNEQKKQVEKMQAIEKIGLVELYFLNKIGLGTMFFETMRRRINEFAIKNKIQSSINGEIVLTTKDNKQSWTFSLDEEEAYLIKRKELTEQGIETFFTKTINTPVVDMKLGYFPSKATLEKHGVKGITEYSYFESESKFRELVSEKFNGKIVGIGDFENAQK